MLPKRFVALNSLRYSRTPSMRGTNLYQGGADGDQLQRGDQTIAVHLTLP